MEAEINLSPVLPIDIPERVQGLDPNYDGEIFVSDIDKTYLATQIDSLSGLLRTAIESPESKENIPGFAILLRACRRGANEEPVEKPLFFVSASPPQMRGSIEAKMHLDGIEHDGIIFKHQMVYVRAREFRKLREQIGFKLLALLRLWNELPKKSKLVLFGDDSESDAVIYSLFSEIVQGKIRGSLLSDLLVFLGVYPEERESLLSAASALGEENYNPLKLAFVNLATGSQSNYYLRFGPRFFATDNSLQGAFRLFEEEMIRERAVRSVCRDLVLHHDHDPRKLVKTLKSGARRGLFRLETLYRFWTSFYEERLFPPPQERGEMEGELSVIDPERYEDETPHEKSFKVLKNRYSEEGRY